MSPSPKATAIIRLTIADLQNRNTLILIGFGIVPAVALNLLGRSIPWISNLGTETHNLRADLGARLLRAIVWAPALSLSTSLGLAQVCAGGDTGWWRRGCVAMPQVLTAAVIAGLVRAAPSSIVHSLNAPIVKEVAGLLAGIGTGYLLIRTFVWIPAIVNERRSALGAFQCSWSATQTRVLLILFLLVVVGIPLALIGAALQRHPTAQAAFSCATFPIAILMCCRTYDSLRVSTKSN